MEPVGTEVTTSGEPHQLVYMCRQHYRKKSHTIIGEIFKYKNFVLKYFHGLGLLRKYITMNFYTRMKYYVRKMEDYTRDLCVRGFHVYRDIREAAKGEERQGMLRTGMLWR